MVYQAQGAALGYCGAQSPEKKPKTCSRRGTSATKNHSGPRKRENGDSGEQPGSPASAGVSRRKPPGTLLGQDAQPSGMWECQNQGDCPFFAGGNRETRATNHRRSRTKFTDDQLKILINTFNQEPYLDSATKEKLALETNIDESRIQIWFQNRRARRKSEKKTELEETLESSQSQGQICPAEEKQRRETRQCRTSFSPTQLHTLIQAFAKDRYPGIECREQLAEETGVPESRVQTWFQNRRSRYHSQRRKKECDKSLEQDQDL
ncbi:double homeobox protein A [Otolemur garnettii]|uniref:double homeobox protein A n=1 Tax=Otolemur garnettii TaxID=30611 RepID=UPI0006441679|nr:double homeobox protein A [Otolemur garnettii]